MLTIHINHKQYHKHQQQPILELATSQRNVQLKPFVRYGEIRVYPAARGAKNTLLNRICVRLKNNLSYLSNPVKILKIFAIFQNTGLK